MDANNVLLWWPEFFAQIILSAVSSAPLSQKNAELKTPAVPAKES